jgi:hypothetical protein
MINLYSKFHMPSSSDSSVDIKPNANENVRTAHVILHSVEITTRAAYFTKIY